MIATVSIGLVGCSDFLVREPKLKQSNELTLATYDGLNSAVAGAYSRIAESGWYGQSWIIDAEMRSGNGVKDQVSESQQVRNALYMELYTGQHFGNLVILLCSLC